MYSLMNSEGLRFDERYCRERPLSRTKTHLSWIIHLSSVIAISILWYELNEVREDLRQKDCVVREPSDESSFKEKEMVIKTEEDCVQKDDNVAEQIYDNQFSLFGGNQIRSSLDIKDYLAKLQTHGSSGWCNGSNHTNRICRLRDICYLSQKDVFVFFHGQSTVQVGIPVERFDPALLDSSSVANHNTQYFNYDDVPSWAVSDLLKENIKIITKTSLIFNRFLPDNIMHVFHDDLLPMYHTLNKITHGNIPGLSEDPDDPFNVHLVFADRLDKGSFHDLYNHFSTMEPVYLSDVRDLAEQDDKDTAICFHNAYIGLTKETTWYQYGFQKPQGPLEDSTVSSEEIHKFNQYFLSRVVPHSVTTESTSQSGKIVLVSRKRTRIIVNESDLLLALASKYSKFEVVTVSLESHSIKKIIEIFTQASVVIGIHGSLLIFSMFLPPGAVLVELFPYGVNPDNYTPYRSLALRPGMNILYKSWRNMNVIKTVIHPERDPEEGGILHLPQSKQEQILMSSEVPPHLCCSDAEWLFRIYQDTIVNIDQILELVDSGLEAGEQIKHSDEEHDSHLRYIKYPSKVAAQCYGTCDSVTDLDHLTDFPGHCPQARLFMVWTPPWNIQYFDVKNENIEYEIWVQKEGEEKYKAYYVKTTSLEISEGIEPQTKYHIWIRTLINNNRGSYTFLYCSTA